MLTPFLFLCPRNVHADRVMSTNDHDRRIKNLPKQVIAKDYLDCTWKGGAGLVLPRQA